MTVSDSLQEADEAVRHYHEVLVPVLLAPAARLLLRHAGLRAGDAVLDVGCGTGVVARLAAQAAGAGGRVHAIDLNAAMIAAARALPAPAGAAIRWHEASATALPFAGRAFDAVVCAQTLQFIPDRAAALAEMRRVLRPGGRLALSVWGPLASSRYFVALVEAVEAVLGPGAAAGIRAVFALGDPRELHRALEAAGFRNVNVATERLPLAFGPPGEFVPRHLTATPLAGRLAAAPALLAAIVENVVRDMEAGGAAPMAIEVHVAAGAAP